MKELNNANKLVRAAGTMGDVLDALDSKIDASRNRTALLIAARKATKKAVRGLNKAAMLIDSAREAYQAVDNWDANNPPGVVSTHTTDPETPADSYVDPDSYSESTAQDWQKTLNFLFTDPDLQDD